MNPLVSGGLLGGTSTPVRFDIKSKPVEAEGEAQDRVVINFKPPVNATLTYTAPTAEQVEHPVQTTNLPITSQVTTYAPAEKSFGWDLNNPLAQLDETPGFIDYTAKLGGLEVRYPGLTVKLKEAEARAWIVGVSTTPGNPSNQHTQVVLTNPPWPQTDFGSRRPMIQAKAKELQQANPQLTSNKVEDYDFGLAKDCAEDLFTTMDSLFPQWEFEGAKFATRAKTPQSLEAKLAKRASEDENFSLAHLTDSVGARLDCRSLKMLGDAATRLEEHYGDKIVAKDDYLSKPGALGYRALHYIVDLGDRMAEIQLSTHDLRATDLATHDTLYKPFFDVDEGTRDKLQGSADRVMEAESFRCLCGYR